MTKDEVRSYIEQIHMAKGDDESQHSLQDALFVAVLTAIAEEGCGDPPKEVAKEALRVLEIDFSRWCA